jgi:putative aminopeptidase FrvX
MGDLVAGYFLDDRADLVSWLLALNALKDRPVSAIFAATAAEEVGGEGALFLLQRLRPAICIALELGPAVPDAPVELTDQPTLWVNDGYSAMAASDVELVEMAAREVGLDIQYQALSRGGSDASCAAHHGLCARPITLGLAMENSHGYEVMHSGAMQQLANLTVELVRRLAVGG